jgi:hypothetical protein
LKKTGWILPIGNKNNGFFCMSEAFEATYKTYPFPSYKPTPFPPPTSFDKKENGVWLDNTKPKTHLWLLCFENLKVW